jgi:hypothetical protein
MIVVVDSHHLIETWKELKYGAGGGAACTVLIYVAPDVDALCSLCILTVRAVDECCCCCCAE